MAHKCFSIQAQIDQVHLYYLIKDIKDERARERVNKIALILILNWFEILISIDIWYHFEVNDYTLLKHICFLNDIKYCFQSNYHFYELSNKLKHGGVNLQLKNS